MMSASMGQVGPPMHPGMPQQPPPPTQPPQAQQIELKYDNVNKVKTLVWALKESFAKVMKVASQRVNYMAAGKTEDTPPRFDKVLEDFFSICNQIELHMKTIQECTLQQKDSTTYLPLIVSLGKQDATSGPPPEGNFVAYSQLVSVIKGQVNFVKSLQDMLNEGSRKITQPD